MYRKIIPYLLSSLIISGIVFASNSHTSLIDEETEKLVTKTSRTLSPQIHSNTEEKSGFVSLFDNITKYFNCSYMYPWTVTDGSDAENQLNDCYKTISSSNLPIEQSTQLPFELWKHIISFVDDRQLKSIRTISRAFGYIVQADVNRPLTLVLNKESDFLLYLSHHPNYSLRHIKIQFIMNKINKSAYGKLSKLFSLSLYYDTIDDEFDIALASNNFHNLTNLSIYHNNINTDAVKFLTWGKLHNLTTLYLNRNNIDGNGARALASGQWPYLTSLNLYSNRIGDDGAKALASGQWPNLTSLDLGFNNIGHDGAQALAADQWPNLIILDLSYNVIKDDGAKALAAGQWPSLTSLNLCSNRIGDDCAQALVAGQWPNLTSLRLDLNDIGETSFIILRKKFKDVIR